MGILLPKHDAVGRVLRRVCLRTGLSFQFEFELLVGYLQQFLATISYAKTNVHCVVETKSFIVVLKAK